MMDINQNDIDAIVTDLNGQRVLVASHRDPDFDAMGSSLAFYHMLKAQGVQCQIWCGDPFPENSEALPGLNEIVTDISHLDRWTRLLVVDCARRERVSGIPLLDAFCTAPIINIDHHQDNTRYGDLSLIVSPISSVGELLVHFFRQAGWVIGAEAASCLYAAVLTDTGGFQWNVTANTFEVAADLVLLGARPDVLAKHLLQTKPMEAIETIKDGLNRLVVNKELRLAYSFIPNVSPFGDELVDLIRQLADADVIAVFRMTANGQIRVNLRSKVDFNVAEIAGWFGGGGHLRAAGFTLAETMETAISQTVSVLENALAERLATRGDRR